MTFCMSSRHSNQLSYAPVSEVIIAHPPRECKGFFKISIKIFHAGIRCKTCKLGGTCLDSCELTVSFYIITSFHV